MATTYNNVNTKISAPINYNTTLGAIGSNSTYSITAGGTSGQFLTTGGSNGTTWATNTAGYQISPTVVVSNDPSSLDVKGKIIHNGRDLEERLSTIEKVLMIPERDVKLEAKYPKLKKLYDDYINALGKYRTFESIKGDNNV